MSCRWIWPTLAGSVILFRQATNTGLVRDTSSDRLQFFAAAERAKRLGSRNPAGFFVTCCGNDCGGISATPMRMRPDARLNRMPEFFHGRATQSACQARPQRTIATTDAGERSLIRELVAGRSRRVPQLNECGSRPFRPSPYL